MKLSLIPLLLLLIYSNTSAALLTPEEIVRETTNDVLDRLERDRPRLLQEPGFIKTIVQELVMLHFDFVTMSRVVTGQHWQQMNEQQQSCFSRGFRNLLVERYADILLSYDQESLTYDPAKPVGEMGYMSVRQVISRESARPLPVDYSMHQTDHGWKVVDLAVDGISLLKSYNKTFDDEITTLGLDEFIQSFPECSGT